ncbi:MAG: hypothetical protein ACFFFG_12025 [Candidatus Thorarchaeota archaeon]
MKVDLSEIPNDEVLDNLVNYIKDKEGIKVKKEGKTLNVPKISARKLKFYTKKVLRKIDLPGHFKVISKGPDEGFMVYFREFSQ